MANSPKPQDGLPTGRDTSLSNDVFDPHPSNEEQYDRQKHPGGTHPPKKDLGPNDAIHNGRAKRRSDNVDK